MTWERAFEVLRWGMAYARPRASEKEYKEALSMLAQDPTLAEALSWPQPPDPPHKDKR